MRILELKYAHQDMYVAPFVPHRHVNLATVANRPVTGHLLSGPALL